MANVTVIINGTKVEVPAGSTILDAANKINVHIPTLCYCPDVGCGTANKPASCRLCLVEATGIRGCVCTMLTGAGRGKGKNTAPPPGGPPGKSMPCSARSRTRSSRSMFAWAWTPIGTGAL